MTGLDALEMLLAGASAVQVGTAVFHDPSALARVSGELAEALSERGLSEVSAAVGLAHGYAATGGAQ
jgi:dihydroorotate dehydrogenase (NAD+) catalytic subunit